MSHFDGKTYTVYHGKVNMLVHWTLAFHSSKIFSSRPITKITPRKKQVHHLTPLAFRLFCTSVQKMLSPSSLRKYYQKYTPNVIPSWPFSFLGYIGYYLYWKKLRRERDSAGLGCLARLGENKKKCDKFLGTAVFF